MKTNFLFKYILVLTITSLLFLAALVHGDRTFISITMVLFGSSIGGLIGVWIREKKNIKPNPKLKKELLLFWGLAMVLSFIWYLAWDAYNTRWIGIALIFFIALIIVVIKNNKCLRTQNDSKK